MKETVQVILFTFILWQTLMISSVDAAVWDSTRDWDFEDEIEFSQWIKSAVSSDIFSKKDSPYFGIKTDCADSALALRIIFAAQNGIPFFIGKNSSSNRYSSNTNRYDLLSPNERLIKFIDDISLNFASENLAYDLSYSIAPEQISPGDLYIYEDQGFRHTYIIKDKQDNGNFILWYSTVPRKIRPLLVRIGMPAKAFNGSPYGFRRFRLPQHFMIQEERIPQWNLNSGEQYSLLENLGQTGMMKEIRRRISLRSETFDEALNRRIQNSCVAFKARVELVEDTKVLFAENNYTCLNKSSYDLYSTPSRDGTIYQDLAQLKQLWLKVRAQEIPLKKPKWEVALDYFSGLSRQGKKELYALCPHAAPISWKEYLVNYSLGLISSSPYALPEKRWGLEITGNSNWQQLEKCQLTNR